MSAQRNVKNCISCQASAGGVRILLRVLAPLLLQLACLLHHGFVMGHGAAGSGPALVESADAVGAARERKLAVVLAVMLVAITVVATAYQESLARRFGPPAVTMQEAYKKTRGPSFDQSVFSELVSRHVDDAGWVGYQAFRKDADKLDRYIETVAGAPFADLGRDEKLALLINGYNAFTLRLILDYWSERELESIKDIPADKRWADARWEIGGHTWSLDQIEHKQIRPKFKEPRVHFALVCAAIGCPPLRTEAYVADRIDAQLEDQARYVHNHETWFHFEAQKNVAYLTPLYKWYRSDFVQVAGSVLKYASRYSPEIEQSLDRGRSPKIKWLEYDWGLNSKRNKRPR
jgi:hypothetical protein